MATQPKLAWAWPALGKRVVNGVKRYQMVSNSVKRVPILTESNWQCFQRAKPSKMCTVPTKLVLRGGDPLCSPPPVTLKFSSVRSRTYCISTSPGLSD